MKLRQFWVSFVPKFVRAKDRDEAADIALQGAGDVEIDEIEEDFLDLDDDS